jgi:hypothetical protein
MKSFHIQKDDFAEVAADPVRRRVKIDSLTRLVRTGERAGYLFFFLALAMSFDHGLSAVGPGLAALLFLVISGQAKSDLHLLQTMGGSHDKPSA